MSQSHVTCYVTSYIIEKVRGRHLGFFAGNFARAFTAQLAEVPDFGRGFARGYLGFALGVSSHSFVSF